MSHIRRNFWARYKRCTRCQAGPGAPCTDLRSGIRMKGAHPYRDSLNTATPHELEIRYTGDECVLILVDGVELASLNHDEHGWVGIEAATNTARAMALATDMTIRGE